MKKGKDGTEKVPFYAASISWGKDSLYMLEIIIRYKLPLNLVVFVNTGCEFDCLYQVRDQYLDTLKKYNIPYVELDVSKEFQRRMFEHSIATSDGSEKIGYGWCGGPCRWGTSLKFETLAKYYRQELSAYSVVEYVGIAFDEKERMDVSAFEKGRKLYPLIDYGLTESDCLQGCYDAGYFWMEDGLRMYDFFDRLSCFCCRNKNLRELKNMYFMFPKYWKRLAYLQTRLSEPMKGNASVFDLAERFQKEGYCMNMFLALEMLEKEIG